MPEEPDQDRPPKLPEELVAIIPEAAEPLSLLYELVADLGHLPASFNYRRKCNDWHNQFVDQALKEQRARGLAKPPIPKGAAWLYSQMWFNGETTGRFDALNYGRSLCILRSTRNGLRLLRENDFIGAMTMFRSMIEQIADYFNMIRCIRPHANKPAKEPDTANESITGVGGILTKHLAATKIDWNYLGEKQAESLDEVFSRKKLGDAAYTAREDRLDLEAKSVLSSIDRMDKRVPGSRITYEILCEFTHPNTGLHLGLKLNEEIREIPETKTLLVDVSLSSAAPRAFYKSFDALLLRMFQQFSSILLAYKELRLEAEHLRANLHASAQVMIRAHLTNNPQFRHPYIECPCGSGKKIRFCCGSSTPTNHQNN